MSISVDFHVHESGGLEVHSEASMLEGEHLVRRESAHLRLRMGSKTVNLYFDRIEDIDRLAFESANLAMMARTAWDQTQEIPVPVLKETEESVTHES